jgi:polar amino acid transport system substrate-binding protein
MKKILLGITVLLLVFTLSACKRDNEDTLKVGMELKWPPFEMKDSSGIPAGISVDLAYELGKYLDRDVEIVDLQFGSLITALSTGEIDVIIASMSITEEREANPNFTFSNPYFYFSLITVLNKDFAEANPIETKEDLFTIDGVRFVGPLSLVSLSIPRDEALNPILLDVTDVSAAAIEITSGRADAFIISASTAVGHHKANPDTTVIMWDPIDSSPIGVGMREDDPELLADINAFIAALDDEGGVYDMLREKYDAVVAEDLPGQGMDFYIYD